MLAMRVLPVFAARVSSGPLRDTVPTKSNKQQEILKLYRKAFKLVGGNVIVLSVIVCERAEFRCQLQVINQKHTKQAVKSQNPS